MSQTFEPPVSFFSRLEQRARQVDSLLCIGLDPHPGDLNSKNAQAALDECLRLVKATSDLALAFKPNSAFFEAYGAEGVAALKQLIAAIPPEVPVILDAKRGDIASTAEAYAQAIFETLGAHALTSSPYLGYDSLEPYLRDPEHGVFLLCKTSNPGSSDLQDAWLEGTPSAPAQMVYERVAGLAQEWNQNDNLGLVAGATFPEALQRIREIARDAWILAPGVGAQGGDLAATLRAGLRRDGMGLLVTVSRAISKSADPRQVAQEIRGAINQARQEFLEREENGSSELLPSALAHLADSLLDAGCVRFGQFTLKSGLLSPIYLDLRLLASHPDLLWQVARAYLPILQSLSFDRLAALPYAALPIGTAISLLGGWPMIYPRRESKEYGTRAKIEGGFTPGETAVVIDDLATTGGSKFEAIDKLASAGLILRDVVVLVDRQSGAAEALAEHGYHLHAVFTLTGLFDAWERSGRVPPEYIAAGREFLAKHG